ncbi:hypothetical protein [Paenibacillus aquistagni]|uniref:hypothetical protein n=1 Tax=Paenibacillus aquistagni TaxID=1852522 RepID=UPI000B50F148|nr:hypothetical protein [Paenibacillus aquistagni]
MKKHSDGTIHDNTKVISLTKYATKKKQEEKNLVKKAVPFSKMTEQQRLETMQAMRDEDE